MDLNAKTIEKRVVSFYLESGDYNGMPLSRLAEEMGVRSSSLFEIVDRLVRIGRLSIASPRQTNPFVKAFDAPLDEQLDGLEEREPWFVCLYPTLSSVQEAIDPGAYDGRPFTKMLVLARPKLVAFPFSLEVLDIYEGDPRYTFALHGFGGRISALGEYYDRLDESDRIDLPFGVGYDDEGGRVLAVYLYRLAQLPEKHQCIWKGFLIDRECRMCDEFFTATILGQPPEAISVYEAIIHEQVEINKLFELIYHARLFRDTFDERWPRGFSVFAKPTQEGYDAFVHLLDKMMSENINISAFGEDVARHSRVEIGEGEFERRQKGSITMLAEWLSRRYPTLSSEEGLTVIEPLKRVRELRQKPAHTIVDDKYDKQFHNLQDKLVWEIYGAVSKLREILAKDPLASDYDPPFWDGQLTVKSY